MPSQPQAPAGLVLAGGDSRRYGDANKLLEPVDGRPLVAHVVENVRAVTAGDPVVAVRTAAQRATLRDALGPETDVRFRLDHPAFEGPLAGLAGALPALSTPWVLVCAGDMPTLSTEALAALADARDEAVDAVVPVRDGVREPLHALYRRAAVEAALSTVPGDAGPRALCSALACTERPVAAGEAPLARSVRNVNTPAEFERVVGGARADSHQTTDE